MYAESGSCCKDFFFFNFSLFNGNYLVMKSSLKVFSKKSLKSVIPNRFTKMPLCITWLKCCFGLARENDSIHLRWVCLVTLILGFLQWLQKNLLYVCIFSRKKAPHSLQSFCRGWKIFCMDDLCWVWVTMSPSIGPYQESTTSPGKLSNRAPS